MMLFRNASFVSLKYISPYQFAMWYRDMMPHDKTNLAQKLTKCSDVLFVVTNERKRDLPTSECGLPMALTIGENKFMILRKCPVVIDYKKFDKQTEQHIWQYSRLLLFHHWKNEHQFLGDARHSATVCNSIYNYLEHSIAFVEENCLRQLRQCADR